MKKIILTESQLKKIIQMEQENHISQDGTYMVLSNLLQMKNDIETIKQFVEDITAKYVSSLEQTRKDKRFIYTLTNIKFEDSPSERWSEVVFESTRSFDNLFFDKKMITMEKIDHFLKNKDWYYNKGIPYSLGIGIHGPPGTGKSSLSLGISNYTKRDILSINMSKDITIILIAHRLNTVKNCDIILKLDKGQIVAKGTFDELISGINGFGSI